MRIRTLAATLAGLVGMLPALAAGGGGHDAPSGISLVKPEFGLIIWTFVTFVLLLFLLSRVASKSPQVTLHGEFCELDLDGRRVAVTHYPRIGKALARGGGYDLVCHGHSHKRAIKQVGDTVRVNPGEVMGRFGLSTYALYDTVTGQASFVEVPA